LYFCLWIKLIPIISKKLQRNQNVYVINKYVCISCKIEQNNEGICIITKTGTTNLGAVFNFFSWCSCWTFNIKFVRNNKSIVFFFAYIYVFCGFPTFWFRHRIHFQGLCVRIGIHAQTDCFVLGAEKEERNVKNVWLTTNWSHTDYLIAKNETTELCNKINSNRQLGKYLFSMCTNPNSYKSQKKWSRKKNKLAKNNSKYFKIWNFW